MFKFISRDNKKTNKNIVHDNMVKEE